MPGINQAMIADAAVSNRSSLIVVNKAAIQLTQQNKPPHNIGLNRQAAPVIKVGSPYNNRYKGNIYSPNLNWVQSARPAAVSLYFSITGLRFAWIVLLISIIKKIQIPKP